MPTHQTLVFGLTGGIASGKSTLAAHARSLGISVFDADKAVHHLLEEDEGVREEILAAFPEAEQNGTIDRRKLGEAVFAQPERLKQLEAMLHPHIRAQEVAFIERARKSGEKIAMLEIPLLFETGAEILCDSVIVAAAPENIRKQRAFSRAHMTEEKWQRIIARQLPEQVRRNRADIVIDTSGLPQSACETLEAFVKEIGDIS